MPSISLLIGKALLSPDELGTFQVYQGAQLRPCHAGPVQVFYYQLSMGLTCLPLGAKNQGNL